RRHEPFLTNILEEVLNLKQPGEYMPARSVLGGLAQPIRPGTRKRAPHTGGTPVPRWRDRPGTVPTGRLRTASHPGSAPRAAPKPARRRAGRTWPARQNARIGIPQEGSE